MSVGGDAIDANLVHRDATDVAIDRHIDGDTLAGIKKKVPQS